MAPPAPIPATTALLRPPPFLTASVPVPIPVPLPVCVAVGGDVGEPVGDEDVVVCGQIVVGGPLGSSTTSSGPLGPNGVSTGWCR